MIRKTAVITAASIAGVIIAGGAAVGANIGILNAADNNSLGELSAEAPVTSSFIEEPPMIEQVVDSSASGSSSQTFTVDLAGDVEVESDDDGLQLRDVRPNQGWAWQETSTDLGAVTITFTSDAGTLEFTAIRNDDGTISASVDRPTTPTPTSPANSSPTYEDDEYDDDDHEGDEYEDDNHEDDEYEDDEHDDHEDDDEYEGRDDDD